MNGRLIPGPREHHCDPGWTRYEITDPALTGIGATTGLRPPSTAIQDGDVWECDCGLTWVAHHDYSRGHPMGLLEPSFRREGRFERWRRERRTRRDLDAAQDEAWERDKEHKTDGGLS